MLNLASHCMLIHNKEKVKDCNLLKFLRFQNCHGQ